jgi:hypothetical protein
MKKDVTENGINADVEKKNNNCESCSKKMSIWSIEGRISLYILMIVGNLFMICTVAGWKLLIGICGYSIPMLFIAGLVHGFGAWLYFGLLFHTVFEIRTDEMLRRMKENDS